MKLFSIAGLMAVLMGCGGEPPAGAQPAGGHGGSEIPLPGASNSGAVGTGGEISQGGTGDTGGTAVGAGSMGGAGCVPTRDCASAGADCGSIDDGCGNVLSCGTCTGFDTCGGAGVANSCGCVSNDTPSQICNNQSWQCGVHAASDSCGDPTSVDCGGCTGYDSCTVGGACICQTVPEVTLGSCVYNGGPKLNLVAPSGEVAIAYAPGAGNYPANCNFSNSSIFQVQGSGVNVPFVQPLSCGSFRICSWDPGCNTSYSAGKTITVCVDGVGQPTCS
jgi:hypothetical protein